MHARVLVPVVLIICSCSKAGEKSGAVGTSDSASVPMTGATGAAKAGETLAAPVAAAPAAIPASRTDCGLKGSPSLKDVGIGDLEVGRTAAVVKRSCDVVRDATELGPEGKTERVLTVRIGEIPVRASVVDDLVWRITVTDPRLATPDGLHVGTPLIQLASAAGARTAEGEDGVYVLVASHCGLSFRFAVQSRTPSGRPWTPAQLGNEHGRATVDRILVARCSK